jgi:hypothetical protein
LPLGVAAASFGAIALSAGLGGQKGDPAAHETLVRAMSVALLLLWPAMMAAVLRNRVVMAAAVAILAVGAAVFLQSTTALIATAAGAVALTGARIDRRRTGMWIGRIGAVSFILAPVFPLLLAPVIGDAFAGFSGLKAWNGILAADGVRVLTGHGFNYVASGYFHGYLGVGTPKSLLFEIWTDLGVLGALASAVLLFWAYGLAASQTARTAPFWMGGLTFVTSLGVFGGATLQLWWITALSLALVGLVLATRGDFQTERPTAPRQTI